MVGCAQPVVIVARTRSSRASKANAVPQTIGDCRTLARETQPIMPFYRCSSPVRVVVALSRIRRNGNVPPDVPPFLYAPVGNTDSASRPYCLTSRAPNRPSVCRQKEPECPLAKCRFSLPRGFPDRPAASNQDAHVRKTRPVEIFRIGLGSGAVGRYCPVPLRRGPHKLACASHALVLPKASCDSASIRRASIPVATATGDSGRFVVIEDWTGVLSGSHRE